jgi:hypothetical protein
MPAATIAYASVAPTWGMQWAALSPRPLQVHGVLGIALAAKKMRQGGRPPPAAQNCRFYLSERAHHATTHRTAPEWA